MARTTTRIVNTQMLMNRPGIAIIIKLMMACNDLSLANEAQGRWKNETSLLLKSRSTGAQMYFVRLQVSHLSEALKIIDELRNDPGLMSIVSQCDVQTQELFSKLLEFLPNGAQHSAFEKVVGRIRHNLGFHYDESGKLIAKALKDRLAKHETSNTSITRGSTAHLWHFELADEVLDRIIVRDIWKIPESADLLSEADNMALWIYDVLMTFIDFCGEFIWKYTGK